MDRDRHDSNTGGSPRREPRSGKVRTRRARLGDLKEIYACQKAAYPGFPPSGICSERQLKMQLETFPDGQFVALVGGKIVGYAMSLIVLLDDDAPWHSYSEITGAGTFSTHDPAGDTLYGADIAVHPDYRGRGIAGKLYERRVRVLRRYNLRRMVAGGRIPGYKKYAGRMTAEEYVEAVSSGRIKDYALNAHLKAGYKVRGLHMGYLRDEQSLNYATFLELENPEYNKAKRRIAASPMKRPVRKIRVCAAQYQMRRIRTWEDLEHQVDFFVTTAQEYDCHYLVMPELFTVQLFTILSPKLGPVQAIAELANMAERYREMFIKRAKKNGLFIVGGTHPVRVEGEIRNVAHLFTPSGRVYTQEKLHVTPNEREEYGIQPGEGVTIFDTGHARVGILVCYDVEFPELVRLMVLSGAEVLFIPFSTDERRAYLRVRYTAQARAIENVVYAVLSGNVGNLPQVENFLINYGQACILTPSDFAFPTEAVAAASDSTTETVVISDLDLAAIEQAREMGSVRPFRDRREDLYTLTSATPVKVIRAS